MYLVTGATGHIGGHLIEILVDAGHEVRAFVREASRSDRLPGAVEVAVGDLDSADSVARAVAGVDGVFHMQADHGTAQTETMITAMRDAGVSRIVALSSLGAVLEPMATMGTWFHARDELLRASGLQVT